LFKEKHASKCKELDVLSVEVAELKSRPALLGACTSCPVLHGKIDEMHAYTVSFEAKLKEPIPTSCSTCELHALKNLELSHYVDQLQDENDELRKLMGWLSGHETQLRIMIETYKRRDGEGHGANKVGEGSGENIPDPPKTHLKNDFPPKPNHLRNRLDTTLDPPVFPPRTNDFQKPIKFVSTSGKVFFGKESEKASEEKPVEKPSGEKPSVQPKPKPKLVRFHYSYSGRDGHKDEFCFKKIPGLQIFFIGRMPGDRKLLSLDASLAIPVHVLRFEVSGLRRRTPVTPPHRSDRYPPSSVLRSWLCGSTKEPSGFLVNHWKPRELGVASANHHS
jgi:hypothetical protein